MGWDVGLTTVFREPTFPQQRRAWEGTECSLCHGPSRVPKPSLPQTGLWGHRHCISIMNTRGIVARGLDTEQGWGWDRWVGEVSVEGGLWLRLGPQSHSSVLCSCLRLLHLHGGAASTSWLL